MLRAVGVEWCDLLEPELGNTVYGRTSALLLTTVAPGADRGEGAENVVQPRGNWPERADDTRAGVAWTSLLTVLSLVPSKELVGCPH